MVVCHIQSFLKRWRIVRVSFECAQVFTFGVHDFHLGLRLSEILKLSIGNFEFPLVVADDENFLDPHSVLRNDYFCQTGHRLPIYEKIVFLHSKVHVLRWAWSGITTVCDFLEIRLFQDAIDFWCSGPFAADVDSNIVGPWLPKEALFREFSLIRLEMLSKRCLFMGESVDKGDCNRVILG